MTYSRISTEEDIRKLQLEMHQLQNQQILLATAALTVFGFAAWAALHAVTTGALQDMIQKVYVASAISLLILLSVLFAWSLTLHSLIVIISSYLELRGASEWEADYRVFHWSPLRPRPRSKTWWVSTIYFVLGLLIPAYFFAGMLVAALSVPTVSVEIVFGTSALYLLIVLLSSVFLPRQEAKIRKKWAIILGDRHPVAVAEERSETSNERPNQAMQR